MNIYDVMSAVPDSPDNDIIVPLVRAVRDYCVEHHKNYITSPFLTKRSRVIDKMWRNVHRYSKKLLDRRLKTVEEYRSMSYVNITSAAYEDTLGLEFDGIGFISVDINFGYKKRGKTYNSNISAVYGNNLDFREVSHYNKMPKVLCDTAIEALREVNKHMERGIMQACLQLHKTGIWFCTRSLCQSLYYYIDSDKFYPSYRMSKEEFEASVRASIIKETNRIIENTIHRGLDVSLMIERDGGESFPVYAITSASIQDVNQPKETVFFPTNRGEGWELNVVTTENNISPMYIADLVKMSIGVNNIIQEMKETCNLNN